MKTILKQALGVLLIILGHTIESRSQSCSSCGGGGSALAEEYGINLHMSMGTANFVESAGNLYMAATVASGQICTPAGLHYDASTRTDVTVVTTNVLITNLIPHVVYSNILTITTNIGSYVTNGGLVSTNYSFTGTFTPTNFTWYEPIVQSYTYIRQLQAPEAIADIPTPLTTNGYVIYFYRPSQVSGQVSGVDQFSGTNFTSWLVTNMSSSGYSAVVVSQSTPADGLLKQWTYSYNPSTATWSWVSLSGLIKKNSQLVNLGAGLYQIVTTVQSNTGPVVQQNVTTYQSYDWGIVPVTNAFGSSSSPQITTYDYSYSGVSSPPPLTTVTHADGAGEGIGYDDSGRVTIYNYSSQDASAAYTGAKEDEYDYGSSYVSGSGDDSTLAPFWARRTVTTDFGSEVGRSYTVFPSAGERWDIQCTAPDPSGGWADSGNLITKNLFYTSGAYKYAPKTIIRPDGTMTTFAYGTNAGGIYQTNITATGVPDSLFTHVVDGTSNYVVLDFFGHIVANVSVDIASQAVLAQDIYDSPDDYGRPQRVTHLDGTTELAAYSCCGLSMSTNRDGLITQYFYDDAKRQTAFSQNGVTYSNVLDAADRVVQSLRLATGQSPIVTRSVTYDLADEITEEFNAWGGTNYYSRTTNDTTGGLIRTTTNPYGGTTVNEYYADGTLKRESGTAARLTAYVPGRWTGYEFLTTYKVAADGTSNEWNATYYDMVGRPYQTVFASGTDTPTSYTYYNSLGQRAKGVDPDLVSTLYGYDAKGEQTITMVDMNRSGTWDLGGTNRVTMRTNDVVYDHGTYVRRMQTYVWSTSSSPVPTLVSTSEISTDGLKTWNTRWNGSTAVTDSTVTVYASGGYRYQTNIAADGSFKVLTFQYGRLLSSVRKDSGGGPIANFSYGYDAFGRQFRVIDVTTGTNTYAFNGADQVTSVTPPFSLLPKVSYTYDYMGRLVATTFENGTSQFNEYYQTGDLKRTYGALRYPVGYGYDSQGRMTKMTNWSNFSTEAGARVTTWAYDQYRGFLSGKTYDGSVAGPSYAYTDAGRLYQRTWARGITTTYSYENAGDLLSVSYSDSTPGVVYGYDRRGRRIVATTGGSAITAFVYNDQNQLLVETNVAGPLAGIAVTNGFDTLLRRNLLVTRKTSVLTSTEYDYDNASRLQTVTDGTNSGNYVYPDNSSLVSQIVFKQNTDVRMTTGKSYDHQNRLTEIDSLDGMGHTFDVHAYGYNDLDQRTGETNVDGAYWANGYDFLGQVTSRVKHWPGGTPVPGEQFGYGYDDIGNRTNALMGGDQWGNRLRLASYTANTLNQYTSRTVPGAVDILGSATNIATVTVNGQATYRRSNFYEATLTLTNTNTPVWLTVSNVALLNEGTNDVLKASITGNIYVPKTSEVFAYDADGNLTNDGRWSYAWDGENRLINMTSHAGDPAGSLLKLDFIYDWASRRVQKLVSTNNAGTYVPEYTNRFVYDGWNLLAIFNPSSMIESFMWGLDLSGTMQRAGGVGGLLKVACYGSSTTNGFAAYDGNGNVTALANATDSSLVAQYEYGPFGELLRATGPMAKVNPVRFSTKYQEDETDFIYYGYRYLNASTGKWIERDPIGERGGKNIYAFVGNDAQNQFDRLGLDNNWGLFPPLWNLPPTPPPVSPPSRPTAPRPGGCPCSLSKIGLPGEAGIGPSVGADVFLPITGVAPSFGFEVSAAVYLTTECRVCVNLQGTALGGVGVNIGAGAGPALAWNPTGLDGPTYGVGVGAAIGAVDGLPEGSVSVDIDNTGGIAAAAARGGPGAALGGYGRGFAACTGCADPISGNWLERNHPLAVAQFRALQCILKSLKNIASK